MPSIQSTLTLARRALLAQQGAIAVASDNIANVNTPGYARRRVTLTSMAGLRTQNGRYGGGVDISNISSVRDPYIEQHFRRGLGQSGWHETESRHLELIEGILGGLDENGLVASLDKFWNSWNDLATDPTSNAHRSNVRESAINLTSRMRDVKSRLDFQENLIVREIATKISRVNALVEEIANVNSEMVNANGNISEMGDHRSVLLDELARLTGANYSKNDDGTVSVFVGGANIVERTNFRAIELRTSESGKRELFLADEGNVRLGVRAGEIGALEEVRHEELGEIKRQLDEFAVALVTRVNEIHVNGYGRDGERGRFFFDPYTTGMIDIKLDDDITDSLSAIAVSADGNGGDNQIALSMAELQGSIYSVDSDDNLGNALRSIVTWVGYRVADSGDRAEGSRLAVQQIASWRDSVSGVSLDEEMADMVKYQHAFNAAAKVISAMDSMMEMLITIM